jgi:hypothetical protein
MAPTTVDSAVGWFFATATTAALAVSMRSALSAETTNLAATNGISTTLEAKIFWVRACDSVEVRA